MRRSSTALTLADTGITYRDPRPHMKGQRNRVVISVGSRETDPAIQLYAFGEDGPLWSLNVEVARLCVGPTVGLVYSPTVLLFKISDRNGKGRRFKGEFPRDRLAAVVDFCDDDITRLTNGYDHIHVSNPERLHALRFCIRDLVYRLGQEVPEATCRTGGKEFFAEGGTWTNDMSEPITSFPSGRAF